MVHYVSPMSFLPKNRVYIIAEAGVNHDGDMQKAKRLIEVAAEARADAVKFQLFDADELASNAAPLAAYQERSEEENQHAMLRRLTLPRESYRELKSHAEGKGLDFITTPFDSASARFLVELGVKAIKIPSGELTNGPFLKDVAALGVFTIISTGMSTLEEVKEAIKPFKRRKTPFALLHCVSSYPAPAEAINLRAMETMARAFKVPVGFSDHSLGITIALAAAARGARILEKHFTICRSDPGPDHAASLEPPELTAMVRSIREIEVAIGTGEKICQLCERNSRDVARRSLVLACAVRDGEKLTKRMIRIQRPGTGLPPAMLPELTGKTFTRDLDVGTLFTLDDLA